ncbi:MAG: nuclear transport factor 2 family protein, partial [Bryobacteraceae bacterium]|nr:nuclear transport factor 2 family protein [Bryobacteraceae bacterium]
QTAAAQTPEKQVVEAVQKVFDAMTAKDAAVLEAAFVPDAVLVAVREDGRAATTPASKWAASIVKAEGALLERMWSPKVFIDGNLAALWAPYDFYRAGKFSHCGTDQVTLVRQDGLWKIALLAYTIKRTGCAASPLGEPKR